MNKKQEIFKCPKCGEPTVDDPTGYSPPIPYCEKCKHICNWECPEAERLGFDTTEEYKSYLKGKKEVFEEIEKSPLYAYGKSVDILMQDYNEIKKRHLSTFDKSKGT